MFIWLNCIQSIIFLKRFGRLIQYLSISLHVMMLLCWCSSFLLSVILRILLAVLTMVSTVFLLGKCKRNISDMAGWSFRFVCLCKQNAFDVFVKDNGESSSRLFTGPPTQSEHTAASLSRKETKGIKECKRRRDKTLAICAHRIRQNAEWQRHVFSLKKEKLPF